MATAVATRRLFQAHRIAQLKVAHDTIRTMRAAWPLLDPNDLDRTFQSWFDTVYPSIQGHRATSAQIAAGYLAMSKKFVLGEAATVAPVLALEVNREAVATSMLVTGPLSIKRAMSRGIQLATAVNTAEGTSAASAMRFTLDGGRNTIAETTAKDTDARGWVWVASGGKTCDYCANLDGTLFYQGETKFDPHDLCACQADPAWG